MVVNHKEIILCNQKKKNHWKSYFRKKNSNILVGLIISLEVMENLFRYIISNIIFKVYLALYKSILMMQNTIEESLKLKAVLESQK